MLPFHQVHLHQLNKLNLMMKHHHHNARRENYKKRFILLIYFNKIEIIIKISIEKH
jgi:hypothetical protein